METRRLNVVPKPKQCTLYAAETVCYGSGKVAYSQGQQVLMVQGSNGTTYVYDAVLPSICPVRGTGLLYTYGPETPVYVDERKL